MDIEGLTSLLSDSQRWNLFIIYPSGKEELILEDSSLSEARKKAKEMLENATEKFTLSFRENWDFPDLDDD